MKRTSHKTLGERNPNAVLTDDEVELIRYLREAGLSYGQIARKFDDGKSISKSQVRNICLGLQRGWPTPRH